MNKFMNLNMSKLAVATVIISSTLSLLAAETRYTITDLGTLGGTKSYAFGVNESGQVAGRSTIADGSWRAFVTDSEHNMINLGILGGTFSYAFGVNESGQVAGRSTAADGQIHAFITDSENNMIDLGQCSADAFNNQGQVTGSTVIGGKRHAFVTDNLHSRTQPLTIFTPIPSLPSPYRSLSAF